MIVLLNVMVTEGPVNDVVTYRNGLYVFLLGRRVVGTFLLERLVTRTRAVVVRARTSDSIALKEYLVRICLRLIVIITSNDNLAPCELPNLVRNQYLTTDLDRAVRRTNFFRTLENVLVLDRLRSRVE